MNYILAANSLYFLGTMMAQFTITQWVIIGTTVFIALLLSVLLFCYLRRKRHHSRKACSCRSQSQVSVGLIQQLLTVPKWDVLLLFTIYLQDYYNILCIIIITELNQNIYITNDITDIFCTLLFHVLEFRATEPKSGWQILKY